MTKQDTIQNFNALKALLIELAENVKNLDLPPSFCVALAKEAHLADTFLFENLRTPHSQEELAKRDLNCVIDEINYLTVTNLIHSFLSNLVDAGLMGVGDVATKH